MIANINSAVEPPDPGLKSNRGTDGASVRSNSDSNVSSDSQNVLVDGLLGRVNDISTTESNDASDIASPESADYYTKYARSSILDRPASALAAQANQLPSTVLQLLQ